MLFCIRCVRTTENRYIVRTQRMLLYELYSYSSTHSRTHLTHATSLYAVAKLFETARKQE